MNSNYELDNSSTIPNSELKENQITECFNSYGLIATGFTYIGAICMNLYICL